MMFSLFFFFASAKKRFCVCNTICSYYCPNEKIILNSQTPQSFQKYIETKGENEKEIELVLYSQTDDFFIDFDSTKFTCKTFLFKTIFDSKSVTLHLKQKNEIKSVAIKPNHKFSVPDDSSNSED